MFSKLAKIYLFILNYPRGLTIYLAGIVICQFIAALVVLPPLIPIYDGIVSIVVHLFTSITFLFYFKAVHNIYKRPTLMNRVQKTVYHTLCSLLLLLWVFMVYLFTLLGIGEGFLGSKLIKSYEVPNSSRKIFLYQNSIIDTSFVVKRSSGFIFLKEIRKLDGYIASSITAFRVEDDVELVVDSHLFYYDVSEDTFRGVFDSKVNLSSTSIPILELN